MNREGHVIRASPSERCRDPSVSAYYVEDKFVETGDKCTLCTLILRRKTAGRS